MQQAYSTGGWGRKKNKMLEPVLRVHTCSPSSGRRLQDRKVRSFAAA